MSAAAELGLSEALALSASQHPSVRAKQADVQAAQGDQETAKWARYPTLSTEVTTTGKRPQGAVLVQQPLWAGGKIDAQIRMAEANVGLSEAGLSETRNSLMLQAGQQFFEVLRWRQRLQVALKNEIEHQKLKSLIDRRVVSQISPVADQVLANARLQQAVSERIQFNRSLQSAQLALQQLVGVPSSSLRQPRAVRWQAQDEALAIASAKSASAELQRLRTQQQLTQAQIDIADASVYPTLVLAHRRALGASEVGVDPNKTYLAVQFSPGPGLSAKSAAAAARLRMETVLQNAAATERLLEQQVSTSMADLKSIEQQLEPAQALVSATDEVVDSYLRQYQIGKKNWLDVLNAVRESSQAAYSAVDVSNNKDALQLRLMLLTGQLSAHNLAALHD
jgi:adhesin transport system outer membrane protein